MKPSQLMEIQLKWHALIFAHTTMKNIDQDILAKEYFEANLLKLKPQNQTYEFDLDFLVQESMARIESFLSKMLIEDKDFPIDRTFSGIGNLIHSHEAEFKF